MKIALPNPYFLPVTQEDKVTAPLVPKPVNDPRPKMEARREKVLQMQKLRAEQKRDLEQQKKEKENEERELLRMLAIDKENKRYFRPFTVFLYLIVTVKQRRT